MGFKVTEVLAASLTTMSQKNVFETTITYFMATHSAESASTLDVTI